MLGMNAMLGKTEPVMVYQDCQQLDLRETTNNEISSNYFFAFQFSWKMHIGDGVKVVKSSKVLQTQYCS